MTVENPVKNQPTTKKRERSTAYPAFSLEQVINDVGLLKNKLGKGPYSRDSAAQALGYSGVSGASSSRIAACVHFGLLARNGGSYNLSELSERILFSESDSEKQLAIVEAAQSPSLYGKIITEFDGQPLPQMLENILVRRYGISDNAVATAVKIFRESIEYAGLLQNGIVSTERTVVEEPVAAVIEKQGDNMMASEESQAVTQDFPIQHVSSLGGKVRGINEQGKGWAMTISIRYDLALPRELRKKINALTDMADEIVDDLNKVGVEDAGAEK